MREDKEFDDYVKGLFENDPNTPAELEWESMEFELPQTAQPKNKLGRKFLWLLLLPLLFGTCSVGYFYLNNTSSLKITNVNNSSNSNEQISDNNANANSALQNTDKENNAITEISTAEDVTENMVTSTTEKNPQQANLSMDKIEKAINDVKDNSNNPSMTSDKAKDPELLTNRSHVGNFVISTPVIEKQNSKSELNTVSKINSSTAQVTPISNVVENNNIKTIEKSSSPLVVISDGNKLEQNSFFNSPDYLPVILRDLEIPIREELSDTIVKNLDVLSFDPTIASDASKPKIDAFYIGYGYSRLKLIREDSTDFRRQSLRPGTGKYFYVGARKNLNSFLSANVQLNYDRLHTIFEYSRELDPIFDFQNSSVTYRTENTYHNNYTDLLGVQLGMELRKEVFDKLVGFVGLGVTPAFVLKSTGRTIRNRSVGELIYDDNFSKFSLATTVKAGLNYNIDDTFEIGLCYDLNAVLRNKVFISDYVSSKLQHKLSLSLGYRFGK